MKTLLAAVAVLAGSIPVASGQTFPSRTLTLIVPFSAGGPTDTIGRIMAQRMGAALGQTVVVENVTGAGGTIAGARVARAAPDGYTLDIGHLGTHVISGAIYELQYDVLKDFEPVAMIAANPQLIVARKSIPAKDLKELIAWVKANRDKVSVAIGGFGSPSHVAVVYFQNIIGLKVQIVPYRGAAPAMNDLLAGHVDMMFDQAANSLPQVRAGTIRAYAVTARARLAAAPDIPTVDEAGLDKFYMSIWHGIWAPRGTPRNATARLNAAIVESLADPAVRRRLVDLGQEIPAREQQTPEYLAAYHKAEIEKWWPMIKAAGVKGE
ncbi:MAG TPA: tripartite tricarboxylate transporter substrate-binding protein [Burkholderiales bacterium]|nr:tripartite tricarboxylate transporter substrate-binding protein [Burkholderiales bacterium]